MSQQFQQRSHGVRAQHHRPQVSDHDDATNPSHSITPSASGIIRLQQSIGNQAVMRLMNRSGNTVQRAPDPKNAKESPAAGGPNEDTRFVWSMYSGLVDDLHAFALNQVDAAKDVREDVWPKKTGK